MQLEGKKRPHFLRLWTLQGGGCGWGGDAALSLPLTGGPELLTNAFPSPEVLDSLNQSKLDERERPVSPEASGRGNRKGSCRRREGPAARVVGERRNKQNRPPPLAASPPGLGTARFPAGGGAGRVQGGLSTNQRCRARAPRGVLLAARQRETSPGDATFLPPALDLLSLETQAEAAAALV